MLILHLHVCFRPMCRICWFWGWEDHVASNTGLASNIHEINNLWCLNFVNVLNLLWRCMLIQFDSLSHNSWACKTSMIECLSIADFSALHTWCVCVWWWRGKTSLIPRFFRVCLSLASYPSSFLHEKESGYAKERPGDILGLGYIVIFGVCTQQQPCSIDPKSGQYSNLRIPCMLKGD